MYAVTVLFQIDPTHRAAFLPLMVENARASVSDEPGCSTFDVWSEGDSVYLYEVYADRAAFDAHLMTDHFLRFDAATRSMIVSKQIQTFGHRHA